jgi:WD40 repeat protein
MVFESQGSKSLDISWQTSTIRGLHFSTDGNTLTSVSTDGVIRIWDANTYDIIATQALTNIPIWAVAWNSDGTQLAYGGQGDTLELVETPTNIPPEADAGPDQTVTASSGRTRRL